MNQQTVEPGPAQKAWLALGYGLFLHFGPNTFAGVGWGDGKFPASGFAPTALDPAQWAGMAAEAGMRYAVLTAKHHDGFCLWPSRYTEHSVKNSPWKQGRGDVVKEISMACRRHGLKFGVYLSPWDRHERTYGDSPRYNEHYRNQLTELLGSYGRVVEVWFDGACGEGPNGRRQVYDWPSYHAIIRRLQPHAVVFSDAGPDVRWIGNERGIAGDPCWSPVNPARVPFPGKSGKDVIESLQHGDRDGTVWRPGESDVSIRPG